MTELSAILYQIGKWSGVMGFFCLSFLIFSGDTARYWDKYFGLDRIIKFQRKFSLIISVFILAHPLFFILANGYSNAYFIPDFALPALALGIISLYIFVAVMIASTLYKRVSYLAWQIIHVITYILFGFALYHGINWGSDADILSIPYLIAFIAVFVGAIYRTVYKIANSKHSRGEVVKIESETSDTFSVYIKIGKPMRYRAGQFSFLRIDGRKLHARHPFTMSSAPNGDTLRFTVKNSGRFTQCLKDNARDCNIHVDGPFGTFIPPENKPLVFIAGGVGITPFMSIIEDRVKRNIATPITLYYGSKTEQDIIFRKRLDAIKAPWLKVVYVISDTAYSGALKKGYVSEDILKESLNDSNLYYLCGPTVMRDVVVSSLNKMGVSNKRIFFEDFFW